MSGWPPADGFTKPNLVRYFMATVGYCLNPSTMAPSEAPLTSTPGSNTLNCMTPPFRRRRGSRLHAIVLEYEIVLADTFDAQELARRVAKICSTVDHTRFHDEHITAPEERAHSRLTGRIFDPSFRSFADEVVGARLPFILLILFILHVHGDGALAAHHVEGVARSRVVMKQRALAFSQGDARDLNPLGERIALKTEDSALVFCLGDSSHFRSSWSSL